MTDPVLTPVTMSNWGRVPASVQPQRMPTEYAPYMPPPERARTVLRLQFVVSGYSARRRSAYDRTTSISNECEWSGEGFVEIRPLGRDRSAGTARRLRPAQPGKAVSAHNVRQAKILIFDCRSGI